MCKVAYNFYRSTFELPMKQKHTERIKTFYSQTFVFQIPFGAKQRDQSFGGRPFFTRMKDAALTSIYRSINRQEPKESQHKHRRPSDSFIGKPLEQ